jgi:hypothetical protein
MRKLTVGISALGSLMLFVGTIVVALPQLASAQSRDDTTFDECFAIQEANIDLVDLCRDNKVLICHFNEGADFGKVKCQEPGKGEGGYESHIGPLGHGTKDFCIRTEPAIAACLLGEEPPCDPKTEVCPK